MPCIDCSCSDEAMPLDTILTARQWEAVCPEGGVLCAACIVRRAAKLPHVVSLTARITFAADYDGDEPGGRYFAFMKQMEGLPVNLVQRVRSGQTSVAGAIAEVKRAAGVN